MNPYPDRIAELHDHLRNVWSQRDTQATEILLAALLPSALTRMRRPWIVVETDYLSRDTRDAWFSFGLPDVTHVRSLAIPRVMRPYVANGWVDDVLMERPRDVPGLFTDPEWRRLPYTGLGWTRDARATYYILMAMCVKLRVAYPKGDSATRGDRDADLRELARLTRRVLDSAHRTREASDFAVAAPTPKSLFYWCELLQKVSVVHTDWESLTGSLASIARGISVLYADSRVPDWSAAERVLRDCVPYATGWLMQEAAKAPAVARDTYIRSGGDMLSKERVTLELRRLHREGVLLKRQGHKGVAGTVQPWKYRLGHADWHALLNREERILI